MDLMPKRAFTSALACQTLTKMAIEVNLINQNANNCKVKTIQEALMSK